MIPATTTPFWQYFDVVSLSVLTIMIVVLLTMHYRNSGELLSTISKNIAQSSRIRYTFSIIMTVFFPLYYAFLWFWVGPLIHMPLIFYILLLISAVCEMLFVWLPARGKTSKAHTITAGSVGTLMFVSPVIMLVYGIGLNMVDVISIIIFLTTAVVLAMVLISGKFHRYTLRMELLYCVMFLMMMSVLAHS